MGYSIDYRAYKREKNHTVKAVMEIEVGILKIKRTHLIMPVVLYCYFCLVATNVTKYWIAK